MDIAFDPPGQVRPVFRHSSPLLKSGNCAAGRSG
jgi:hypothetical protein